MMHQPPYGSEQARALRDQGITALQAGDRVSARRLLEQAAQLNPADEHTWLWLSGAVDSDEQRRHCLERVLSLNPNNQAARQGLAALPAIAAPAFQPPAAGYQPPGQFSPPLAQPNYSGYPQSDYLAPPATIPAARGSRPGCITALAIFFLLGGFALSAIVVLPALLGMMGEVIQGMEQELAGLPAEPFLGVLLLFGLFALATGVGLWRGDRWGWWLAAVNYTTSIILPILGIIFIAGQGVDAYTLGQTVGETLIQSLIPVLILVYLFRPRVWHFFRMDPMTQTTAAAVSFGVGIILAVAFYGLLLSML